MVGEVCVWLTTKWSDLLNFGYVAKEDYIFFQFFSDILNGGRREMTRSCVPS